MKYMFMVLIMCITSSAVADPARGQNLQSVEKFEQLHEVSDFLGVTLDHRDDERCRRYGDCRYPDRPGRPGRPGYPDHPRRPGYPDHPRRPAYEYICYAENARRMTFWGIHRSPRFAQQLATDACYYQSRYCYELGCQVYR